MSQRSSGYERKKLDFYATPTWVTEALVGFIRARPGSVWEPADGEGDMVKVLKEDFAVLATDINKGVDFLAATALPNSSIRGIITNPPYKHAEQFCSHAIELTRSVSGFVAMLLRCDFDHAAGRAGLFQKCPQFAKKIVLRKRIVWFVNEKTGKPDASPSFNHAWFLWDHTHVGLPTIEYAP